MDELLLHPTGAADKDLREEFARFARSSRERVARQEFSELEDAELISPAIAKRLSPYSDFAISDFDRARHIYIAGMTGMAKSTLIEAIVIRDINAGRATFFLDPHGDSAEHVLDQINSDRIERIAYQDLSRPDHCIPFNPLLGHEHRAAKQASFITNAVKSLFFTDDFNAPRFTDYFWNALVPLIERGNCTFEDVLILLTDKDKRDDYLSDVRDPLCRQFWKVEYPVTDKRYNSDAMKAITNKLRQILSAPEVRNVLYSKTPTLNLKAAMFTGQAVIVNLAKGSVGGDAASFLGSLYTAEIERILFSRTTRHLRPPLSFVIDEFQSFSTTRWRHMVAELRKYGLWLTLAHQFPDQIDEPTRKAIFANTKTKIVFALNPEDAKTMAPYFNRSFQDFQASAIVDLPPFHAYVNRDGVTEIQTNAPKGESGRRERVICASQTRFARSLTQN